MYCETKEELQQYLKSIKSKYSYDSVTLVFAIIDKIVASQKTKTTISDIVDRFPRVLLGVTGYLWEPVLKSYRIDTWEDIGNIVIICIDLGLLKQHDDDNLEEFKEHDKVNSLFASCKHLEKDGFIVKNLNNSKK